jgi:ubiquinone/menaquinone biosynthesis C-methylase UbiE
MLSLAAERLRDLSNVELKEISGYDLKGVADASVDVVYCTVVFTHLEPWDQYGYVLEAFRVLRPNGRIYVDNIKLCSDGGWKVFEAHRAMLPAKRPPHMTENSTPQEIETYLRRAGFSNVRMRTSDDWVPASGLDQNWWLNS